ncbi:MAG: glycosyltransferase family 2 protein [Flavobacteriaceae bacterium]|tara:strand:- start:3222 stop:4199 length:978 start_codon:yes stop_codon:yes gene_type:complete
MKSLAVVILNYNGIKLMEKFLPSVIKFTPSKYNIYIIDNGSSDGSVEFIRSNFKKINIVELNKNYGYAKGYNIGLKKINDDILCLLNNDVEVTEKWTEEVMIQFKNEKETAVIQPKMKDSNKRDYFDYAGASGGFLDRYGYPYCNGRIFNKIEKDNNQYNKINNIFWACGACFFVRNNVFKKFGGFDEIFWAHFEEIDLCWRLQNSGHKISFNPNSTIYHVNAGTLNIDNPKKTYFNFRNMLFTITKNSKHNLFLLLFEKHFIDVIIAIYLLFSKGPIHFIAIIKAYLSFYKHINLLIQYRRNNKREIIHYKTRSIICEYLFHKS